jgi:hypothetical protein
MADLAVYNAWLADEARATQSILGSMKVEFAMDLSTLPTTQAMWERAQALYQPSSTTLYISTLKLASSTRQQDSSVDVFYLELAGVWRQLDSLEPPYCRTCPCCVLRHGHNSVPRLHEFLLRLRLEFEQLRAQLLARSPLPPRLRRSP